MKRVVVLFWALVLGIITGFIGAKLDQSDFNLQMSLVASIIFGLLLNFIPEIAKDNDSSESKE